MSNETPESIAERIISGVEFSPCFESMPTEYCRDLLRMEIAEAIRKERVLRVPKHWTRSNCDLDEIKKLNEGKTFVEGE
jgi:hypothetical protein